MFTFTGIPRAVISKQSANNQQRKSAKKSKNQQSTPLAWETGRTGRYRRAGMLGRERASANTAAKDASGRQRSSAVSVVGRSGKATS
jgi:hypothetical protein